LINCRNTRRVLYLRDPLLPNSTRCQPMSGRKIARPGNLGKPNTVAPGFAGRTTHFAVQRAETGEANDGGRRRITDTGGYGGWIGYGQFRTCAPFDRKPGLFLRSRRVSRSNSSFRRRKKGTRKKASQPASIFRIRNSSGLIQDRSFARNDGAWTGCRAAFRRESLGTRPILRYSMAAPPARD
jgi:hypothetical protein